MMSTQFNVTLGVNDFAQDRFEQFVQKMSKVAVKLGLPSIQHKYLYDIIIVKKKVVNSTVTYIEKVQKVYEIQGQVPVLDGWTLVARLNYDRRFGDQAMIAEAPGQTISDEFLGTINPHRCDHCHVQRFRNKAYVVKKDDEIKQIGSTCLGDFIRSNTEELLEYFAKFWQFDAINAGDDEYNSSRQWFWGMEFAYATMRYIKMFGFQSAKSDNPTGSSVMSVLYASTEQRRADDQLNDLVEKLTTRPTDEEQTELNQIFESGRALTSNNSFQHNVKLLCGTSYWKPWEINILVAWIGMCLKPKTEKGVDKTKSEWLGKEGDKIKAVFTCEEVTAYDGYYGPSWLHAGHAEGNLVRFYATRKLMKAGEVHNIKGTIKAVSEYKSMKQTQLMRVKIL